MDKERARQVLEALELLGGVQAARCGDVLKSSPLAQMDFWSQASTQDVATRLLRDDPWLSRNRERLVDLESRANDLATGDVLVHGDLRADNILLTPSHVCFVDWPHASRGQRWLDLLLLLPSVHMQGGPEPAEVFDSQPLAKDADPTAVSAVLSALAGYFLVQAEMPPPPGLGTLRDFQRAQGEVALRWLKQRPGWKT